MESLDNQMLRDRLDGIEEYIEETFADIMRYYSFYPKLFTDLMDKKRQFINCIEKAHKELSNI